MNFRLKSKKHIQQIAGLSAGLLIIVVLFWALAMKDWNRWDYQVLDFFYRQAVEKGAGPKISPHIVYLTISDRTYKSFGQNILDRHELARTNDILHDLGAKELIYDIIFARPTNPEADNELAYSLEKFGATSLPIGLAFADKARRFKWEQGSAYSVLNRKILKNPIEKGESYPFYATHALMQDDIFSTTARNSGHISAYCDSDGVFRHALMLIRVDDRYCPTLSLAAFLDSIRVPFESIIVEWGKHILIPQGGNNLLEQDIRIPIDERGRTFIPFTNEWGKGFKMMEAHKLQEFYGDENIRGNLIDFFEGNFVLVTDIAVGAADLGSTPLESDAPLVCIHASLLNGMLTNKFYGKWTSGQILTVLCIAVSLMFVATLFRSSLPLYLTGIIAIVGFPALTWIEFVQFMLFPIVSVMLSIFFVFFWLMIALKTVVVRERAFIKGAFAKYLPTEVVDRLLEEPERLKLGGEEQILTILFSDIVNFTAIAEKLPPQELVGLLNQYMTEMTAIVLECGGIIDKYQGDAIMAEFGAPFPIHDHADRAVMAGIKMQRRLGELQKIWALHGFPEICCRIGINTGSVIIGNMGSKQVFDYTVIGDAVNLAARLEGANKEFDTFLMISEFTLASLSPGRFKTRYLDNVVVKGKSRAVKVYEVIDENVYDHSSLTHTTTV